MSYWVFHSTLVHLAGKTYDFGGYEITSTLDHQQMLRTVPYGSMHKHIMASFENVMFVDKLGDEVGLFMMSFLHDFEVAGTLPWGQHYSCSSIKQVESLELQQTKLLDRWYSYWCELKSVPLIYSSYKMYSPQVYLFWFLYLTDIRLEASAVSQTREGEIM